METIMEEGKSLYSISDNKSSSRMDKLCAELDQAKKLLASQEHFQDLCMERYYEIQLLKRQIETLITRDIFPDPLWGDDSSKETFLVQLGDEQNGNAVQENTFENLHDEGLKVADELTWEQIMTQFKVDNTFKSIAALRDYKSKTMYPTKEIDSDPYSEYVINNGKKTRRLDKVCAALDEANKQLANQKCLQDLCTEMDQQIMMLNKQIVILTVLDTLPDPLRDGDTNKAKFRVQLKNEQSRNAIQDPTSKKLQLLEEKLDEVLAELQMEKEKNALKNFEYLELEVLYDELKMAHNLSQEKFTAELQREKEKSAIQNFELQELKISYDELKMTYERNRDEFTAEFKKERTTNAVLNSELQKFRVSYDELKMTLQFSQEKFTAELQKEKETNAIQNSEIQELKFSYDESKMVHKLSQEELMAVLQRERDTNAIQFSQFQKLQVAHEELKKAYELSQEQLLTQLQEKDNNLRQDQECQQHVQQQGTSVNEESVQSEEEELKPELVEDPEVLEASQVSEDKIPQRKNSKWKQFRHALTKRRKP